MDDQMTVREYETPRVIDYGGLQELTAGCLGGTSGDAFTASHPGYTGEASNPAYGCKSTA